MLERNHDTNLNLSIPSIKHKENQVLPTHLLVGPVGPTSVFRVIKCIQRSRDNYSNIVFDRARRAASGTQHFVPGTCVIANCFGKNANRSLTSLT